MRAIDKNREKIYEGEFQVKNGLKAKTIVYRKRNLLANRCCAMPVWLSIVLSSLFVLALVIMLSTIPILYTSKAPAGYLENCKGRSCMKEIGTKCVNDICQCTSAEYFSNKCTEKEPYGSHCLYSYECKDYLICRDGLCQCNVTFYHASKKCVTRKTLGERCSGDQCLNNSMLFCKNGKCACDNEARFWDGSVCVLKRWNNERCNSTSECDETKLLLCISGKCQCEYTYSYYDIAQLTCLPKIGEYENCSSNIQCLGQMTCTNKKCQCNSTKYFNPIDLTCVDRTLNNTVCESNNTCRVDLGLSCQDGFCQCDATKQFWNAISDKCINFMTYAGQGCTADYHCNGSQNLFCNLDNTANKCDCPTTSKNGMCDCVRVIGNETFWDGKKCEFAGDYGASCGTNDYKCKTMTDLLKCLSTKCSLSQLNAACSINVECDYYKGLQCLGGYCSCNDEQYFNTLADKCVNRNGYFTDCTTSYSCFMNLTCTDAKCICPSTQGYNKVEQKCIDCKSGWSGYDERCYKHFTVLTNWADAKLNCENIDSDLVVPESNRELTMINRRLPLQRMWIGISTSASTVNCQNTWDSVNPFLEPNPYFRWSNGQPNCRYSIQLCIALEPTSYNDLECPNTYDSMCEYPP